ncbi:MAG: hypothetical protein JWL69_2912 [Phycisphaerales bacterium]|nr:hypothetical protein [Phycisphaerales bacterium]
MARTAKAVVVEQLEGRRLLSGNLPADVRASADAQYTVVATGTANVPAWNVTLSAGVFSFVSNVGAPGNAWQNLSLTVTGSATLALNTRETFFSLTLSGSARVTAASSGGGADGNVMLIGPGGLSMPDDPAFNYPTATLDLRDNDLILQGGGAAGLSEVSTLLRNGARGGWTGNGLTSSDAAASGTGVGETALGFGLNGAAGTGIQFSSFDGVAVNNSDVLVKYTLAADADLNGNVTAADYQILSDHYGQSNATWATGDFTFDSSNGRDDYQLLSSNMDEGLTGPLTPHYILAVGLPIAAVEGQPFSGEIVSFYDALDTPGNPKPTTAASYEAFVSWGDGKFLRASVSDDGRGDGGFVVTAKAPFVLSNPAALISTMVQYSASSGLQGRPACWAEPLLSVAPAVSNLFTSPASTSEIDLTWSLSATNASAIEVDRSSDGISFAPLTTTLSGKATTYNDTTAGIGQHYFYEIRAIQPTGPSAFSNINDSYAVSAVSDLTATAASTSEIDLLWASNTSDATKFEIDRSTDGTHYAKIATSADSAYNDTGLHEQTHYWYAVRAFEPSGLSDACIPADISTLPNPPTLLSVTAGAFTEADLRWRNNSSGMPGFEIERSEDGSFWEEADSTDPGTVANSDADQGVTDGTLYYFRVRAYNDGGQSDPSNVLQVFIPLQPPSLLTATAASASQIQLTWENDSLSATGFSIRRSTDGITYTQIATIADPGTTTFSDVGLSPGTHYYYQVAATTASLTSIVSNTADSVTTT